MNVKATLLIATLNLAVGVGVGMAARQPGAGMAVIRDRPARDAGLAALAEAERLAGNGSWELIAVGRVYYLSGDKERGQALFDRAVSGKQSSQDYARIGRVYAEAGEDAKATESFQMMLDLDPKDDTTQAAAGSWYLYTGDRARGEELIGKALSKHPNEVYDYVRAAEGLLKVRQGD